MKSNTTDCHAHDRGERCSHYVARGLMLWGPVYTAGVSGMVYMAAPFTHSYTEVLLNSLIICPPLGAAGGYLRWRLTCKRGGLPKDMKFPKERSRFLRLKTGRKTTRRKAA